MYATPSRDISKHSSKHSQLISLIDTLDARLHSKEPAGRSLVSLLSSLAAHLEMHFQLETPELPFISDTLKNERYVREAERLNAERRGLLADVTELVDMAKLAFLNNADLRPVAVRYRAFQNRFAAHEEAEKQLIRATLNIDPCVDP